MKSLNTFSTESRTEVSRCRCTVTCDKFSTEKIPFPTRSAVKLVMFIFFSHKYHRINLIISLVVFAFVAPGSSMLNVTLGMMCKNRLLLRLSQRNMETLQRGDVQLNGLFQVERSLSHSS